MALETLTLGVEGKASLWRALIAVADRYPTLAPWTWTGLLERAEAQHGALEDERVAAATLRPTGGELVDGGSAFTARPDCSRLRRSFPRPPGSLWHGPVGR